MSRSWSAASSLGSRPCASGWPVPACAKPFAQHSVDPAVRRFHSVTSARADDDFAGSGGDHAGNPSDVGSSDVDEDPLVRRRRVEAVLLLAKSPLSPRKLAQLAQISDATEARTHVRELGSVYQDLGRAMRIELIAGGYRMMTRSALAPWLSRLSHVPAPVRLSTPMMETLAIVAYRGPLARSGVEAVRGVACGELLRQLMERDLIRIAGRSEELGRPYLYGTTKRFLQLFGLANSEALPPIQWQTLHEDNPEESSQENPSVNSIPEDPLSDEPSSDQGSTSQVSNSQVSKSSKEPVVSATVASEPNSEANPNINPQNIDPIVAASQAATSILDWAAEEVPAGNPAAVIEDEEDDLYEGVKEDDDDDDWDDDDDDWDDDDEEDEKDDDDEADDDEEDKDDDDDDELDDDWEEVDDSVDDDDDDSEEDDDDEVDDVDQADDDEDWSEDDSDDDADKDADMNEDKD